MKKDDSIFIEHIKESIDKIEEVTKELSKKEFLKEWKIQDICLRRIGIIGEATKNLTKEYREEHKQIPWSAIARTRDVFIHGYFGVDMEETWKIIKDELPKLKEQIKELLKQQ